MEKVIWTIVSLILIIIAIVEATGSNSLIEALGGKG